MSGAQEDLAVLVADLDMEATIRGLLSRPQSLGIRNVQFEVFRHRGHDNGCFSRGHDFLRPMVSVYAYGLIMFDRHGCGQERAASEELERIVTERLNTSGWGHRAAAIAIDPELDVWVWADSPLVERCLGWEGKSPDLRTWLREQGLWSEDAPKPKDPKQAVKKALRQVNKRPSSAVYQELAEKVSLKRCTDASFQRFRELLQEWFPAKAASTPIP